MKAILIILFLIFGSITANAQKKSDKVYTVSFQVNRAGREFQRTKEFATLKEATAFYQRIELAKERIIVLKNSIGKITVDSTEVK